MVQKKIKDLYKTNACFAKQVGISENTLANYFANRTSIPSDNIELIMRALGIKRYEISEYFFKQDVSQMKG
jgi:transcriptional regulator with XRE-family HTH domain